jgi:hypothetical protein
MPGTQLTDNIGRYGSIQRQNYYLGHIMTFGSVMTSSMRRSREGSIAMRLVDQRSSVYISSLQMESGKR